MPSQKHEKLWRTEPAWWPPQPDSEYGGECYRGVWCDTQEHARGTIHSLAEAEYLLTHMRQDLDSPGASRVQVKAIVDAPFLPQLAALPQWQAVVESCFPLDGCGPEFAGTTMLYLGLNTSSRQREPRPEDIAKLTSALQESPRPLSDFLQRVPTEITLRRLTHTDAPHFSAELMNLWLKFGFSPETIQTILGDANNLIIGAFHQGHLVSVGRAQLMHHSFNGVPFTICEHTDAATLPEYESRGLYGAILATQMVELAALPQPPNLLVGETNVTSLPALKISRRVGREFGVQHSQKLGFTGGLMRQDIMIQSEDGAKFKDLAPAFMTREKLLALTQTTR